MFDPRAAKLLTAGQHLNIPEAPGLRLECTETTRSWTYRFKSPVDGRMRQVKIGTWPAMPYPAALAEWDAKRQQREAGADPSLERKQAAEIRRAAVAATAAKKAEQAYTVSAVCADYYSGHLLVARAKKGADEVRRLMNKHLGPIENRPAASISRRDAFDLIEGMAGTPMLASQLRRELGAAWDHAIDAGKLPEEAPNWWRKVMKGKLKSKGKKIQGISRGAGKRVLSEHEVGEVLRFFPNLSRLVHDALVLYLWTGTRGAEIMAIEASEITSEATGLWWTIPKRKTKNARHEMAGDLRVPLVGRAAEVIRRRLLVSPVGYLFPAKSKTGYSTQKTISSGLWWFQPYSELRVEYVRPRLSVTMWSPHDLRRTVRTILASMGCPDGIAEAVLGHMPAGVKGVYNRHQYDDERRHWLTLLDIKLEQLAKPL